MKRHPVSGFPAYELIGIPEVAFDLEFPKEFPIDFPGGGIGHGVSETSKLKVEGRTYSLNRVTMPNGEVRKFAKQYNGYGDMGTPESRKTGMRFGVAWSAVKVF